MRFESHADTLTDGVRVAFENAVDDVVADAQDRARKRTGRFARSIMHGVIDTTPDGYQTRVGSPLSSARAKELGAFIAPKRGPYLVFNAGSGVVKVGAQGVRIPATPAVAPAARNFGDHMTERLREIGVAGGTGSATAFVRPDTRSGVVR